MIVIGEPGKCTRLDSLQPIEFTARPTEMPQLPEGHRVIAVYTRLYQLVVVCESLAEIQRWWDSRRSGHISSLMFASTSDEVTLLTSAAS